MFQIATSVIYPFIGMNLEGSIGRKYYEMDSRDFPSYIGNCLILSIISFFIVSGFFYFFFDPVQKITAIPGTWLRYIVIVALCQFVTAVVLVSFQVRVLPIKYGIVQIVQSIINVGLSLYFVVWIGKRWEGRLEAQIITGIVMAFFSILILVKSKQIKINISKNDMQHALSFGIPLIPHALGGMFFIAVDRFFLTKLIGLEQTGNFTVAYQIGAVISILTFAFNNAYVPWLFDNLNRDDTGFKRRIVRYTYIYFVLLLVLSFVMLLFFPLVVRAFVGEAFTSINSYSTFIVLGFVFQGMYYMVTNYITYARKTYLQAAVTICIALLKIPISYFCILWAGSAGAAISFCLTFFVFFVITWVVSANAYSMPWLSALRRVV
jgi:O-antigen/teichoic acid export membrane protein